MGYKKKLILKEFTLYYFNLDNLLEGKYMVDFISQIQADKIKIVEKLSVQHLVKDVYKVTDEEIYRKLNHAYKQVTEYARYSLGEQFKELLCETNIKLTNII